MAVSSKPLLIIQIICTTLLCSPAFVMATHIDDQEHAITGAGQELTNPIIEHDPFKIQSNVKPKSNKTDILLKRGQLLYKNHCSACHESSVHIREKRKAKSMQDIEYWVKRWSLEIKLNWTTDEILDVVEYVNDRYYQYKE